MKVTYLTLFVLVFLASCSSHSSIIKSELGFKKGTVYSSPKLVMNSEVLLNTNPFKLGALWHKSLNNNVLIVVKLYESSFHEYTEILGIKFIVNNNVIELNEYKSKTYHESALGKSFNLLGAVLGGGGAFSFKAYLMEIADLRSIIKNSDTVKIELKTSSRGIAKGDFKKDFYGSAFRGLTDFVSKVDALL